MRSATDAKETDSFRSNDVILSLRRARDVPIKKVGLYLIFWYLLFALRVEVALGRQKESGSRCKNLDCRYYKLINTQE